MKPEEHVIDRYMKPVLMIETLFDKAAEAKKTIALVAVKDCSIDLIFRGRKIDYYSEDYDLEVNTRTLELIKNKDYDLILAYNQEYDDIMHNKTPTLSRRYRSI